MDTLIKLFCERPVENVMSVEVFRPKRVIFLCAPEIAENPSISGAILSFFKSRGINAEIGFLGCSQYQPDKIIHQLEEISKCYPDIVLDVTGGTETALFAAGMFCQSRSIPAFTYSRKKNTFYNVCNAEFSDCVPCNLTYSVPDFFLLAGGEIFRGRVDNSLLAPFMKDIDSFFTVFLRFRKEWPKQITFFQRISRTHSDESDPLSVSGSRVQKGEQGSRVTANRNLLYALAEIGFIQELSISEDNVSFSFRDQLVSAWLRDVGSVLELFTYKTCLDTGIFQDVRLSVVVNWDESMGRSMVSNEIDVVASRSVTPLFISCKTCEIKTDALNELAILRDRFGGKGAKAVIITSEICNSAARHRAAQLQIAVIDREELNSRSLPERFKVIMKVNT